jgi:hypothetical protein
MRYFHLSVAAIFALFAYWQLNDPDWPRWVVMYGFVSLTAGWKAFSAPPSWLPWLGLGVALAWLATLFPAFLDWMQSGSPTITGQMKAESLHVELTREFLGLLIVVITLGAYTWAGRSTT